MSKASRSSYPKAFWRVLSCLVCAVAATLWAESLASANDTLRANFGGMPSCESCHTNFQTGAFNKFGAALCGSDKPCKGSCYAALKRGDSWLAADCAALRGSDSDCDGTPNAQELSDHRNPGVEDACVATTCPANAGCHENCGATCSCGPGFTTVTVSPLTCSDNDECLTDNGGCGEHATCTNTPGSRSCECDPTFVRGPAGCTCPQGFAIDASGKCVDINECDPSNGNCAANSTCKNSPGGYSCPCNGGYFGDGKQAVGCTKSDVCVAPSGSPTCSPLVNCALQYGTAKCAACPAGYKDPSAEPLGRQCDDVDECATNNGGCDPATTCSNAPGTFSCSACPSGTVGDGLSGCKPRQCDVGCAPYAVCSGQSCACPAGFSGDGRSCEDVDECQGDVCGGSTCYNLPGAHICSCASASATRALPVQPRSPRPPSGSLFGSLAALALAVLLAHTQLSARRARHALLAVTGAALLGAGALQACGGDGAPAVALLDAGLDATSDAEGGTSSAGASGSAGSNTGGSAGDTGAAGSAGTGTSGSAGAGGCARSCECSGDQWCNPATAACEPRHPTTPVTFDDVRSVLSSTGCTGCHFATGSGDVDPRGTGTTLLLAGSRASTYASLVNEGVDCASATHRVCVDEPALSLLASQTLDSPSTQGKPSIAFSSWGEAGLQTLLRWIASGAPRAPLNGFCGDGVVQSGEECDDAGLTQQGCAYGSATCSFCSSDCKLTQGKGPYCGDGRVDPPYETCDDAGSTAVEVDSHGGAICGPNCGWLPGKACGADGLPCCTEAGRSACGTDEACVGGTCQAACGVPGKPCCDHTVASGHADGCRDFSYCASGTCTPCGALGSPCCPNGYKLAVTGSQCDRRNSACDYTLTSPTAPAGTCSQCGSGGDICCEDPQYHELCNTGTICALQSSGPNRCDSCGDEYQDCCCPGGGGCLDDALTCDAGKVCVRHDGTTRTTFRCQGTCGALNQPCCNGKECARGLMCSQSTCVPQ